ncbi:MAG: 4-hydroxy-tetrahydrodipicolinate synthase [Rhodospirillales bacterium]
MFQGSITALITPFTTNGAVDEAAYVKLIEHQIAEGTQGLVPCGTTGESPTLSHDEHKRVVELCIEVAGGRVPVIAGSGSNSTQEAIELTQHAEKAGAQAALVVTPYYNKPTQAGLYSHFKAIHDATDIPIVIYNIPGRSVIDMSVATLAQLAKLDRIVAVKDATGDLERPMATRQAIGADFCQLSGEDATAIPFLAGGGHGCISVTSNVAPGLCARMQKAWAAGDIATAMDIQHKLFPLHKALFCESNPVPSKFALSLLGFCEETVRLPLVPLADASRDTVRSALKAVGLIG